MYCMCVQYRTVWYQLQSYRRQYAVVNVSELFDMPFATAVYGRTRNSLETLCTSVDLLVIAGTRSPISPSLSS